MRKIGGDKMSNHRQTPGERREKLRQKELKHPSSSIHGSNLSDTVGGMGWKSTGIMMLVLIFVGIIYFAFIR